MWVVELLAIMALLLLAACTGSSSGAAATPTATSVPTVTPTATATQDTSNVAATITMNEFNFTGATRVTIKAGQAVRFDDTEGSTHILIIGTNGQFKAQSGAPPELNSADGTNVNGDIKVITFPTAGTYPITCTLHPDMQATVIVK
jgi:plastocyanin